MKFSGKSEKEIGIVEKINENILNKFKDKITHVPNKGDILIRVDSKLFRPLEVESLTGNSMKAKQNLGWAAKTSIQNLAKEMVKHDLLN